MIHRFIALAMVALSCVFVALAFPFLIEPVVFTAEDVKGSGEHYNPLAFPVGMRPKGGEVLPLMGELLNGTGRVAITIGAGELERAEEELKRLLKLSRHFDTLVIELNVTEGDLKKFQEEHRENVNELRTLLQESRELEDLKQLEIRRTSSEAPGQVEFAAYRGASIRVAIEQAYASLSNRSTGVLDLSRSMGVDGSGYRKGVESLERMVEEARRTEETLSSQAGTKASPALYLEVSPERVRYGGFLEFRGRADGDGADDGVELYIDGIRIARLAVGRDGAFVHRALIRESSAGEHIAVAKQGSVLSPQARFTIEETEAELTLEAEERRSGDERWVQCTGTLNASGVPVVHVPVEIRKGEEVHEAGTDEDGRYELAVPVAPGEHTFVACFGGEGYPLRPVCSAPVRLLVKAESPLVHVIVYALFAGVSLLGVVAWRSWRGGRVEKAPSRDAAGVEEAMAPPEMPSGIRPSPEEVIAKTETLLERGEISEAAFLLYTDLLARIPAFASGRRIRTLTPREAAALLGRSMYAAPFARFVHAYERVRYGGEFFSAQELIERYREALPQEAVG